MPPATPTATNTGNAFGGAARRAVHAEAALATAPPTPTDASDPAWVTPDVAADFQALDCTSRARPHPDVLTRPLVICSSDGTAGYVLGPAELTSEDVVGAIASPEVNSPGGTASERWMVTITLSGHGSAKFASVSARVANLAGARNQVAIVVDSVVVMAPRVIQVITDGTLQITGSFTQADAKGLAARIHVA